MRKITVLGDGGWGTALAMTHAKENHIYSRQVCFGGKHHIRLSCQTFMNI